MSSYACHTLPLRNYVEWLGSVFWQYFYVDMTNTFHTFLLWFLKISWGCTDCAWVLVHPLSEVLSRGHGCARSTSTPLPCSHERPDVQRLRVLSWPVGSGELCWLVFSLDFCLSMLSVINTKIGTVSWLRNPFDILAMTHGVTHAHRVASVTCGLLGLSHVKHVSHVHHIKLGHQVPPASTCVPWQPSFFCSLRET